MSDILFRRIKSMYDWLIWNLVKVFSELKDSEIVDRLRRKFGKWDFFVFFILEILVNFFLNIIKEDNIEDYWVCWRSGIILVEGNWNFLIIDEKVWFEILIKELEKVL